MVILTALRDGPAAPSQMATMLGVQPANLTRHVPTLVDAGLVEPDRTCDTGRSLEKYYRTGADTFDVAPESEELAAPHKVALYIARSDHSAAFTQPPDAVEQPGFCCRIEALAREFEASDSDDGAAYHVNLGIYPGPWNAADPTVSLKQAEDSR